jgi:toxin ParE1/3/4
VLPVRLRSIADAELAEALKWYATRSRDVATRFLGAVEEALERIRQAPDANPLVTPTLRRVLLRRFPYAVYYRVFPTVISVVGVVHGRRHPRRWLRRG